MQNFFTVGCRRYSNQEPAGSGREQWCRLYGYYACRLLLDSHDCVGLGCMKTSSAQLGIQLFKLRLLEKSKECSRLVVGVLVLHLIIHDEAFRKLALPSSTFQQMGLFLCGGISGASDCVWRKYFHLMKVRCVGRELLVEHATMPGIVCCWRKRLYLAFETVWETNCTWCSMQEDSIPIPNCCGTWKTIRS